MADETELFDATDPAAIDNAQREAKRKQREDADALRALMHSKAGRSFLYRRLERCHIYATTADPESTNRTFFQLGEENVGKQLMAEAMDASPDLYILMIKEQRDEAKRLDEVRKTEARNREKAEAPVSVEQLMPDLPPPAGYPGGPPLPRKK